MKRKKRIPKSDWDEFLDEEIVIVREPETDISGEKALFRKEFIHDHSLSLSARGLGIEISGDTHHFGFSNRTDGQMAERGKCSEKTIKKYLKQLEDAEYINITMHASDDGKLERRIFATRQMFGGVA